MRADANGEDEEQPLRSVVLMGTARIPRRYESGQPAGYDFALDPEAPDWVRRQHMDTGQRLDGLDSTMTLYHFLRQQPEGARVRLTIETVWEPPAEATPIGSRDGAT